MKTGKKSDCEDCDEGFEIVGHAANSVSLLFAPLPVNDDERQSFDRIDENVDEFSFLFHICKRRRTKIDFQGMHISMV